MPSSSSLLILSLALETECVFGSRSSEPSRVTFAQAKRETSKRSSALDSVRYAEYSMDSSFTLLKPAAVRLAWKYSPIGAYAGVDGQRNTISSSCQPFASRIALAPSGS